MSARWLSLALLAALLAAPPSPLGAQIPLVIGRPAAGRLTPSDPIFGDSSHYKMYGFAGGKGDTITAELSSDDFDANLILSDGSGNPLSKNDDGGGACNARLVYVLPQAGNYRLYANSSWRAEVGAFRISFAKGSRPVLPDSTCHDFSSVVGMVQVGQSVTGVLTDSSRMLVGDSSYVARWVLPVQPNQTFTVDLISDDFDPYLWLIRPRGEKLVENNDGGGSCNARIVYTAADDRPLHVRVNTALGHQTGRYTLRVSQGGLPTEVKGNCRFRRGTPTAAAPASAPAAAPGRTLSIALGQSVTGSLTTADELWTDTTYIQRWRFPATAGLEATVDLDSDDFEPYLMVDGPGLAFEGDLHSGPGCAARLIVTFPQSGSYEIDVNTTTNVRRSTGRFTLSVTSGRKPKVQDRCTPPARAGAADGAGAPRLEPDQGPLVHARDERPASHAITVGQSLQGTLTRGDILRTSDSTYAQAWTIAGRAGQVVTIDVESDEFDAYLFLQGPGIGGGRDFQDDDSGGHCNARLTLTFPQTGDYSIIVNTQGKYATGAFTLSVTSGAKPKSVARCTRGG